MCGPRQWSVRRAGWLFIALLITAGFDASARAASIVNLELIPDGSADPPGDRLEFTPVLSPTEKDASIEVRAYVVSADRKHSNPVDAKGKAFRDRDGHFLLYREIDATSGAAELVRIVVPYDALRLESGTHWLAYCITLKCGKQAPLVVATKLTQVIVSDQPRSHMQVKETTREQAVDTRDQKAHLGTEEGSRGNEAEEHAIKLALPTLRTQTKSTDVSVNIPGGFERRVPPPEISRGDDSSYAERDGVVASPIALAPLSAADPKDSRTVYFATNRALAADSSDDAPKFTADLGDKLITGQCVVNIPVQHQRGDLEQPSFWQPLDPKDDFLVESSRLLPADQVFKDATAQDLLLYVHGFNTEFDFAVLRAAQLHYDLQFPGAVMTMCWPSAGSMTAYTQDRQHAEQSAGQLADLLQSLVTAARNPASSTPRKIHILAHSLGNDVLVNAIYQLHARGVFPEKDKLFGQIVLAAPDVGALEFNNMLPFVIDHSERVTYYYCTRDQALGASRQVNQYEPVGLMPFFRTGLDTINTDAVDTSFLFHGYYASSRQVLSDVELLLNNDFAPRGVCRH